MPVLLVSDIRTPVPLHTVDAEVVIVTVGITGVVIVKFSVVKLSQPATFNVSNV